MAESRIKSILTNELDKLWVQTAVDRYLANQPYQYKDVHNALWDDLPAEYKANIDARLLHHGQDPTLHAISFFYPDHPIIQQTHNVIIAIRDIIRSDFDRESITSLELAGLTGVNQLDVEHVLGILSGFENFLSGSTGKLDSNGRTSIRIAGEIEIIQAYKGYSDITQAMEDSWTKTTGVLTRSAAIGMEYTIERINALLNEAEYSGYYNEQDYRKYRSDLIEAASLGISIPARIHENVKLESLASALTEETDTGKPVDANGSGELALTFEMTPTDEDVSKGIASLGVDYIIRMWRRAWELSVTEPDEAIGMAKSMLEGVLKHLLEQRSIYYKKNSKVKDLLKKLRDHLKEDPLAEANPVFVLSFRNISALTSGLVDLRNELSPAHGKGSKEIIEELPSHYATLAIGLAGHISSWLIAEHNRGFKPLRSDGDTGTTSST